MRPVLAVFLLCVAASAAGETCKYLDKEGRVTYSNVPLKGAKKVQCFEPPPVPMPPLQPEKASAPRKTDAPGEAPKVDQQTQRKRDVDRRRILEQELADEEGKLSEARKALLEQQSMRSGDERNFQKVLERLKPYQDAVAQHEKNIQSIKQELANSR
jgi:hypothetical protein